MKKLFVFLGMAAFLLALAAGGGMYWLSAQEQQENQLQLAQVASNAVASSLGGQVGQLNQTVSILAQAPETITAMALGDAALLAQQAKKLEQQLPFALKIRLLPPSVSQPDEQGVPRMGYADVDLAREAVSGKPIPAIQGDGSDRHLALASRISQDGKVIGILLASCSYDFIGKAVHSLGLKTGYLELKQEDLVLAASGDQTNKTSGYPLTTPIPRTHWKIEHWPGQAAVLGPAKLSMVLLPAFLLIAAVFTVYFRLSKTLTDDLASVLKAAKDLISGKLQGSYPVKLAEMEMAIATLAQHKRISENQNFEVQGHSIDLNLYEFSDEPSDLGLDDLFKDILPPTANPTPVTPEPPPVTQAGILSSFNEAEAFNLMAAAEPEAAAPVPAEREKPEKTLYADVFKEDCICGLTEQSLNMEFAYNLGCALGTMAITHERNPLLVARDVRLSGEALAGSLIKGIIKTGTQVLDLGQAPAPLFNFVCRHIESRSGAMVTSPQSDPRRNGFLICFNGEQLHGENLDALRQLMSRKNFASGLVGRVEQQHHFAAEYIGMVCDDITLARPLKIVVDGGNGAGGVLGAELFRALGCEVIELFCDSDGHYPNHAPDPGKPENLADLAASVKHYQAELGIAFDSDASRLGVVDGHGKIIWPDRLMMLFAKDILRNKPGAEIIYDTACSRHLGSQIVKFGGKPLLWQSGNAALQAKIKETGAKLAGNMDGHIFFNDRWHGYADAFYAAARLLAILSDDARSPADILAEFPELIATPELELELPDGEAEQLLQAMLASADFKDAKIIKVEGMRVEFTSGWGLARLSKASPALIFRFEADSKEAMDQIQDRFRQLIKRLQPGLALPFDNGNHST
ncbi:MAG: phosphomannomutase/phosphoglucomutase [Methylobacter sp.]|nr:MAG: phosphomannomutase/phosphoglucomutase [Methylobacter sp.]